MTNRFARRYLRALQLVLALALLASAQIRAAARPQPQQAAGLQPRAYLPLVAAPGGPAPAQPSDQALIADALAAGRIDRGTALLYRAYALFADPRLPAEFQGSGSIGEDSGLFVEAADPGLPADVRAALRPYLVRPDDPASVYATAPAAAAAAPAQAGLACEAGNWAALSSSAPGVKIRVHARCTGDYQRDIEQIVGVMEGLWAPMVSLMGPPIPDQDGGSDDIDVYLLEPLGSVWRRGAAQTISAGIAVAPWDAPRIGLRTSGFMLVARADMQQPSFRSTLAHEFFHVLQKAHNEKINFQNGLEWWFVEASAVWAEANFVPESSGAEAHARFVAEFQDADDPLHTSDAVGGPKHRHEYASYIWPFFMEQEAGAAAVGDAWRAIGEAGTDWARGMAAIDAQLPFNIHFHRFALRNLNNAFGGDNPLGTRYVQLDSQFYDGYMPAPAVDEHLFPADAVQLYPDTIPSLRAHYYHFTIDESVRQIEFDFGKLQPLLDRKVDAVVKIRGQPWTVLDQLPDLVRFCRDIAGQDVEEIWFVVSDHSTDAAARVAGELEVRAQRESCGCSPDLVGSALSVEQWQGAVTLDYSAGASDSQWRIAQQRSADIAVTLGRQPEGPRSYIGSPTGRAQVEDWKYMRDARQQETLFLSQVGSGPPVPYVPADAMYSRVTLNFRERDCSYNWRATFYVLATVGADGVPPRVAEVDIGSVQSDWMPISSTLVLAGQLAFPAHSPEYIFDHGAPFYEQSDYELAAILGEGGLGAAAVTWRFAPAAPPAGARRR